MGHIIRAHRTKKDIICDVCGFSFMNGIKLSQHKVKEHKDKAKVKCELCPAMVSKGWLSRHMKSHEEGAKERFSCDKCDFKTDFRSNLKSHKCQECSICGVRVQSRRAMKAHMGKEHSTPKPRKPPTVPKEYKCDYCSKTSNDWGNIQKHMKSCNTRQRREQPFLGQVNKDKLGKIFSKTKNTSMSDFNIILGGFMDVIGKHFFEKGAKQAAKEFNYATEEHHETVTGLPFVDNKGRPLESPRSLAKIKYVETFLNEIKVGRGIKQGHGQVALGCDGGKRSSCWDV